MSELEPDSSLPKASKSPKFSLKKRISLYLGTAIAASVAAVTLIKVPIACSCANPAISFAGIYTRSQRAYFEEHKVFGKSLEDLRLGIASPKSTLYDYDLEVQGDRAFIYATPRFVPNDLLRLGLSRAEVSGVVGAVIYNPQQKATVSIVCFADATTLAKPPQPSFTGSAFACPTGYRSRI